MTQTDGRIGAWISAWKCLKAAQKLKTEPYSDKVRDPLPELYWSIIAEAAAYAELAKTTETVGLMAGDWLREEQEREAAE